MTDLKTDLVVAIQHDMSGLIVIPKTREPVVGAALEGPDYRVDIEFRDGMLQVTQKVENGVQVDSATNWYPSEANPSYGPDVDLYEPETGRGCIVKVKHDQEVLQMRFH